MGLKADILQKVKEIIDGEFSVDEISYVPDITDTKLTFGNTGLRFEATVLYIDIRGSTAMLNNHNRRTVAKIHMAYFHTIVKLANNLGGAVRSFNGDSMLVFFPGTKQYSLNQAVKCAMQMVYMISNDAVGINTMLTKYSAINFGIGLDDGKILCTKIGVGGDSNNKDLIWIGNAVNKSTVLSDRATYPNRVYISSYVFSNLNDDLRYNEEDGLLGKKKVDMWHADKIEYNGIEETCYYTSYHYTVK
jgi:adenylate cyclase